MTDCWFSSPHPAWLKPFAVDVRWAEGLYVVTEREEAAVDFLLVQQSHLGRYQLVSSWLSTGSLVLLTLQFPAGYGWVNFSSRLFFIFTLKQRNDATVTITHGLVGSQSKSLMYCSEVYSIDRLEIAVRWRKKITFLYKYKSERCVLFCGIKQFEYFIEKGKKSGFEI